VTIHDLPALKSVAGFDEDYLCLDKRSR
jgi:hypothetical protein